MFSPYKSFTAEWHPEPGVKSGSHDIHLICRPGGEVLVRSGSEPGFPVWPGNESPSPGWPVVLIGKLETRAVFLSSAPPDAAAPPDTEWVNIRPILGALENGPLEALCRASMLASWDHDHRCCGRCGSPTGRDAAEAARVCPECGFRSYPRVSPAMIVRIVDGERILLAHNRRFPEDVYSCVAGYVEPGETLEDTVVREIFEEVGLHAEPPKYIASQAWPFPHSLMLGFETTARGEPVPDGIEITDARWFTPDNLPHIPRHGTIARTLIDGWLHNIGCLPREESPAP
jgi:NAD+ diphosphatase